MLIILFGNLDSMDTFLSVYISQCQNLVHGQAFYSKLQKCSTLFSFSIHLATYSILPCVIITFLKSCTRSIYISKTSFCLIRISEEWLLVNNTGPQGYKTFFVLVLRLVLRTRNLCSTENDTKNRGYKSSPLSWVLSTYSNIITYSVGRDCFKNARI